MIEDSHNVTIYGKPVFALPDDAVDLSTYGLPDGAPQLVSVHGSRVRGACVKFDDPFLLILPGDGEDADGCGFHHRDGFRQWKVWKRAGLLRLDAEAGEAESLVSPDFAPLGYPKVRGHFHVRDISVEDAKLSFTIDAGASVKYHKWDKWHDYSLNRRFTLEISQCVDWNFGIASIHVCAYVDRICGEVRIVGQKVASHCEHF